jgi:HEAT repeat protein
MTRWTVSAVLVAMLTPAVRADETDDLIARQLAAVVRDPRLAARQRVEAARTLGKLGPRAAAAVPELVAEVGRLRGAELEPLQEAVVLALGSIGPAARGALPAIAKAAGRTADVDQAVKRATEQLVAAADGRDLGLMLTQLGSRDASVRLRAAKALGAIGPDARAAVPALTGALADGDGDVRRAAVAALRQIRPDARPTDELIRAYVLDLKEPDADVRLLAARGLGRLGPVAATLGVPALEQAANDPDRDVRKAVADALARMAGP